MKVWEVMHPLVKTVLPRTRLTRARELFRKHEIRVLPVVRDRRSMRLEGFLTRREVLAITSAKSDVEVRDVMRNTPLIFSNQDIREAYRILEENGVYGAPVIDRETQRVVGVLTTRDILRFLISSGYAPQAESVAEVMETENIPIISQDEKVDRAWWQIIKGEEGLIVVRKGSRTPVGMLTAKDFVDSGRWYFHREGGVVSTRARVRRIMTRGVVVAFEDTPVYVVAEQMVRNDWSMVPVVNKEGEVIGVVTQFDVIRAYLEGGRPGRMPVKVAAPPLEVAEKEKPRPISSKQVAMQVMVETAEKEFTGVVAKAAAVPELPAVKVTDTVSRARNVMLRTGSNHVLVIDDDGRIIGVVSKRGLLRAIGLKGPVWRRRPEEKEFISEVMSLDVPRVKPNTPVEEVARLMVERDVGVVIIEDDDGKVVGFVTKDSLVNSVGGTEVGDMRVENLVTPRRLSIVNPHHSLAHAVAKMRAYMLDALAVTVGNEVHGVVSESHLPFIALVDAKTGIKVRRLIWVRRLVPGGRKSGRYVKITPLLVEDVMVPVKETVSTGDSVREVIRKLSEVGVDGLPVVDEKGEVVGVVCKNDIVRALARRAIRRLEKVVEREVRRE